MQPRCEVTLALRGADADRDTERAVRNLPGKRRTRANLLGWLGFLLDAESPSGTFEVGVDRLGKVLRDPSQEPAGMVPVTAERDWLDDDETSARLRMTNPADRQAGAVEAIVSLAPMDDEASVRRFQVTELAIGDRPGEAKKSRKRGRR